MPAGHVCTSGPGAKSPCARSPCHARTESGHQASFETLPLNVASSVHLTDGSSPLSMIPQLQLDRVRLQIILFSQIGRIVFPHIVVE
jgi:hypothetical protein